MYNVRTFHVPPGSAGGWGDEAIWRFFSGNSFDSIADIRIVHLQLAPSWQLDETDKDCPPSPGKISKLAVNGGYCCRLLQ